MIYNVALHTDVGIDKSTNQDSMCVKQAETDKGSILLAIVCDGMGGLEKGEVASATVIKAFSDWFDNDLPYTLSNKDYIDETRYQWERIIKTQNQNIAEYGRKNHIQLGSTITAMVIFEDGEYLIGHVGDSRAYRIDDLSVEVLTNDQTLVNYEVSRGKLTKDQAESDPRRNVLLQCIGASKKVEPDFIRGNAHVDECYMLCSDGFRHVITDEEIQDNFCSSKNQDEQTMKNHIVQLIDLNKERGETDNISAILLHMK